MHQFIKGMMSYFIVQDAILFNYYCMILLRKFTFPFPDDTDEAFDAEQPEDG